MRKVKTFERRLETGEVKKATVYFHADWEEYFVKFWINDVLIHPATYHTDDKADALGTADYFVNRE